MGKRKNQNFVSIPYHILIEMIQYKAALAGITVKLTVESYTCERGISDHESRRGQGHSHQGRGTGPQDQCSLNYIR